MKSKMLIVEPDMGHAFTLQRMLEGEGFDVQILFSVNRMDVLCRNNDYDTIFMDSELCDADDLSLITESIHIWPDTRLVLTSKYLGDDRILDGTLARRGFACIDKPFEKSEIKTVVEAPDKKRGKRGLELVKYFLILLSLLGMLALNTAVFASDLSGVPSNVTTPQELARWLSTEFKYSFEIADEWQAPQKTIDTYQGDCEDFAILAVEVLDHLGIPGDIIIVKFRDLNMGHAICVWKEKDGTYSFISNRKMFRSGKNNIAEAIEKFYPDWENIIFTNENKQTLQIVKR